MTTTEQRGAPFVARVFSTFGLIGSALVVIGTGLTLAQGDASAPFVLSAPRELWAGLFTLRADAVLGAGLILMLAVPVVRNVAVIVRAVRRGTAGSALLAGLTLLLLAVLYAGLSLLPS